MNYDTYAVSSVIFFVSSYLSLRFILLPVFYFLTSFTVVRKTTIKDLQREIETLDYNNQILRRGIKMSRDAETGQVSFDLPDDEVQYKYILYTKRIQDSENVSHLEEWEQVWDVRDWTAQHLGKTFVKRGRKYLWVDEAAPTDKIARYPYEDYFVRELEPTKRKTRRNRKAVAQV